MDNVGDITHILKKVAKVNLIQQFIVGKSDKLDPFEPYVIFTFDDTHQKWHYEFYDLSETYHGVLPNDSKLIEFLKNHENTNADVTPEFIHHLNMVYLNPEELKRDQLFWAINHQDPSLVKTIIEKGLNPKTIHDAFIYALHRGQLEFAKAMMQSTLLSTSPSYYRMEDVLNYLGIQQCCVNQLDNVDESKPYILFIKDEENDRWLYSISRDEKMITGVLPYDVSLSKFLKNKQGNISQEYKNYLSLSKFNNASYQSQDTLIWATEHHQTEIVKNILNKKDDAKLGVSSIDDALILAARNNHLDIVQEILHHPHNQPSLEGYQKAFIKAAENGHHKVVHEILNSPDDLTLSQNDILEGLRASEHCSSLYDYYVFKDIIQTQGKNKPSEETLKMYLKNAIQHKTNYWNIMDILTTDLKDDIKEYLQLAISEKNSAAITSIIKSASPNELNQKSINDCLSDAIQKGDFSTAWSIIDGYRPGQENEELIKHAVSSALGLLSDKTDNNTAHKFLISMISFMNRDNIKSNFSDTIEMLLLKCIELGNDDIIQKIIQMDNSNQPSQETLNKAFITAFKLNKIDILRTIKDCLWSQSPNVHQFESMIDELGKLDKGSKPLMEVLAEYLNQQIRIYAEEGKLDIKTLNHLMDKINSQFDFSKELYIQFKEKYLFDAIKSENLEDVKANLEPPLDRKSLKEALLLALEVGNLSIAECIIQKFSTQSFIRKSLLANIHQNPILKLNLAAQMGYDEVIYEMINQISYENEDIHEAMSIAIKNSRFDCALLLAAQNGDLDNFDKIDKVYQKVETEPTIYNELLIVAAQNGDLKFIKHLLIQKKNFEYDENSLQMAITRALEQGHINIALIIAKGIRQTSTILKIIESDSLDSDQIKKTLDWAIKNKELGITQAIINLRNSNAPSSSTLQRIFEELNNSLSHKDEFFIKFVNVYLDKILSRNQLNDINNVIEKLNPSKDSQILKDLIEKIEDHDPFPEQLYFSLKEKLLFSAIKDGNLEDVKANLVTPLAPKSLKEALLLALKGGKSSIVNFIIPRISEKEFIKNALLANVHQHPILNLNLAAKMGYTDVIKQMFHLIDYSSKSIEKAISMAMENSHFDSALLLAALYGDLQNFREIDITYQNYGTHQAIYNDVLVAAAEKGHLKIVQHLFNTKNDVEFNPDSILMAIDLALEQGHDEIALLIAMNRNLEQTHLSTVNQILDRLDTPPHQELEKFKSNKLVYMYLNRLYRCQLHGGDSNFTESLLQEIEGKLKDAAKSENVPLTLIEEFFIQTKIPVSMNLPPRPISPAQYRFFKTPEDTKKSIPDNRTSPTKKQ